MASLWVWWAWQRREECEKEAVFFAYLCHALKDAGTGNAQRFSAIYWTPTQQIWKIASGVLKGRREKEEESCFCFFFP